MIFIRELLIPGNVLHPLILLVMNIDGGDLDEFIEGQDRRDRDDRKLPHESREKAERHDHAPERDTVADHAELRISARSQYPRDLKAIEEIAGHGSAKHDEYVFSIHPALIRQFENP